MDFETENNKEREYFKQDFSQVKELINRIRQCLTTGKNLDCTDLILEKSITFENDSYVFISLFQAGEKSIRWGANRKNIQDSLNRDIKKLRENKNFSNFDIKNCQKCRILLECTYCDVPVKLSQINITEFNEKRFEPGITGIKIILEDNAYIYTPTDAWTQSQMALKPALNTILRKTYIKDLTNKISQRIKILQQSNHKAFLIKSRAFVSFGQEILPLYRGNTLNEYSDEKLKEISLNGIDWIIKNQEDNGKYLYYYDCKDDNYKDHEHPDRPEDDLYYNDLRHCGGIISLIRAYELTKDKKYIISAKKGIDFITTITKEHTVDGGQAGYVYYNKKAKLGGTGVILISMMRYRMNTQDKTYDKYIKMYSRHLISRICESGEMLGYFIHPNIQDGNELISLTDEERQQTFSFYYPGEALLGLALVANHFDEDEDLKQKIIDKAKIALDWIVDERPKIYSDLFTALPSDGWLMQAIEEWVDCPQIGQKENLINFVFGDAQTMMDKMYHKNDSPYIDFEGGFYYEYGDHFYPDGARSEGLIAAYYLANKTGKKELAQKILDACKKAALSQMYLYNDEKNTYAHLNPEKSICGIRFKATRQWVRVDSIQHVVCFYLRLYFALN